MNHRHPAPGHDPLAFDPLTISQAGREAVEVAKALTETLVLWILFGSACGPAGFVTPPAATAPLEVQHSTATRSAPTPSWHPTSTNTRAETVEEAIRILEVSDPASPSYDPASPAYDGFPQALLELAALNSPENNGASMLAYAMGFPRKDSVLAAQALITLGPQWAGPDMAALLEYLGDRRPELRMFTAIILSTTGKDGSCSLGQIGPLLWDPDPYVRTSAALAIQGITGYELVAHAFLVTPEHLSSTPVAADSPEGSIVGAARTWWTGQGSRVNWHPNYDLCDP